MIGASIDELASECLRIRDRVAFEGLKPEGRIAIYGAGFVGGWAIQWLRENHVEPVACFDGNAQRQGTDLLGVPINAPSTIAALKPDLTFVTARHAVSVVSAALDEYGAPNCSLDAYVVALHFDRFRAIHDHVLGDDLSRETLRAVLAAMLSGTPLSLHHVLEKDQYFCLPRFAGAETDVYVDAGAYVGDSVERFIWSTGGVFSSIHAFEPGERQFAALQDRVARLTREWALAPNAIKLSKLGLADMTGRASAGSSSGQPQSLSLTQTNDGVVPTERLDRYIDGGKVTFIKADVEGMELALLKGAAETISRWKPKLAVCVYHFPLDLPDIVAYVASLAPDYRFALRHHSPRLMETVLYAWVE